MTLHALAAITCGIMAFACLAPCAVHAWHEYRDRRTFRIVGVTADRRGPIQLAAARAMAQAAADRAITDEYDDRVRRNPMWQRATLQALQARRWEP